jgi:hypothetical protein
VRDDYPLDPQASTGRVLDAHLHLLDRQVLDVASVPVTAVSDLEISDVDRADEIAPGTPAPELVALLSGPVLATRIFGGRPPTSRLQRIAWSAVYDVGVVIRLAVNAETLDATWAERWVRDHIIGRIPGGRHDPE